VLLNNDAVPEPSWLRLLLASFDDDPAVGAVTSKILFLPRFLPLRLRTDSFVPGPHDTRALGVRVHGVTSGGAPADVLWERLSYGQEPGGYSWTRPEGELLLALPDGAATVSFTWAADRAKDVHLEWEGGAATLPVTDELTTVELVVPAGAPRVDVVNNAGSIVLTDGYGADRGFQVIDTGQYDQREAVFAFCGNGVAFRAEVLEQVGVFDDDFFLYYEDTDLSWRVRAAGWKIRYEPSAVVRHHHAASSGEWSPVFRFHVDRNRLLMLTKDATPGLALREVLRYPLTTASMGVRALRQGLADRRRPPLRATLMRLKVLGSYVRLLPRMLARRRAIARSAAVRRRDLEQWLVPRHER
jgi:GT2 family glycosyltransferase